MTDSNKFFNIPAFDLEVHNIASNLLGLNEEESMELAIEVFKVENSQFIPLEDYDLSELDTQEDF